MQDRGHLLTELRNPRSQRFDRMTIAEAVAMMNAEDATVSAAVAAASADVARAIERVVAAFEAGGRLIYIGAGTSGRLGVLDASECPPTFLSDPRMVQGVIAGGWEALRKAVEGAEDSPEQGAAKVDELDVGPNDVVMGITTGGTTPYVRGALGRARERGAKTIYFACVSKEHVPDDADVSIRVLVGPEVVTGSTRLKAGTATKLVLNMITTISMVRIGKVYENLMVDVNTRANRKLVDRATRMIMTVTGLSRDAAGKLLEDSGGHVKTALVMHARGVSRAAAEALLAAQGGHVAEILHGETPEQRVLAAFSAQFTWVDWLVVVAYLAGTTWLGAAMAGKQQTIRDFFLGGRKLPWYAVSGSIIATEISALTFVSVPWVVFQPGGNFTYLQLGVFGSFFARILVGYILVPAYYQREIYSPYDYMHNRLGGGVRSMTTALFALSGMLAQSARIYLTAEVLNVVMHDQLESLAATLGLDPLAWAIILISGISIAWTLIGGMTTVIWTDVVLFIAFLLGAAIALGAVVFSLDGGISEMFRVGWEAKSSGVPWAPWGAAQPSGPWGKFTFFDWSTNPTRAYTIWTAVIASTWGGLGAYGTDQLMAQRMFCCRNARDARWAIISSALSQVVTITVMLVGVGLFAYYSAHTPSDAARALLPTKDEGDRVFTIFTVEVVPTGLAGVIVAAIFAAAISSVMGILTALSQTIQSAFYNPWRERTLRARGIEMRLADQLEHDSPDPAAHAEHRRSVLVSRLLVVFWGVALSALAYAAPAVRAKYPSILDLGLAMAGYCGGALLAGFALSFLRVRVDGRGFMWSAPLSVLVIFSIVWHASWAFTICAIGAGLLIATWLWYNAAPRHGVGEESAGSAARVLPFSAQTALLLLGVSLVLLTCRFGHFGEGAPDKFGRATFRILAWPWYVPIGSVVAFFWGCVLARRRVESPEAAPVGART